MLCLLIISLQLLSCKNTIETRLELRLDKQSNEIEIDSELLKQFKECDSLYSLKGYTMALKGALNLLDRAQENKSEKLVSNINYLIGEIWHETKSYKSQSLFFVEVSKVLLK